MVAATWIAVVVGSSSWLAVSDLRSSSTPSAGTVVAAVIGVVGHVLIGSRTLSGGRTPAPHNSHRRRVGGRPWDVVVAAGFLAVLILPVDLGLLALSTYVNVAMEDRVGIVEDVRERRVRSGTGGVRTRFRATVDVGGGDRVEIDLGTRAARPGESLAVRVDGRGWAAPATARSWVVIITAGLVAVAGAALWSLHLVEFVRHGPQRR